MMQVIFTRDLYLRHMRMSENFTHRGIGRHAMCRKQLNRLLSLSLAQKLRIL